jgi:hypothetical protein
VAPQRPRRLSPGIAVRPDAPWRVFLSYTSDLTTHPRQRSFVAAAEASVIRAGHAPAHMAHFAPHPLRPAEQCSRVIAGSDVYVGIIGGRYGSPVPDHPDTSYVELEFQLAAARRLPRLVFLVDLESCAPQRAWRPAAFDCRQLSFRQRLLDAGITVGRVSSPAGLEIAVYQALVELRAG